MIDENNKLQIPNIKTCPWFFNGQISNHKSQIPNKGIYFVCDFGHWNLLFPHQKAMGKLCYLVIEICYFFQFYFLILGSWFLVIISRQQL
jgi:hypothetical protein